MLPYPGHQCVTVNCDSLFVDWFGSAARKRAESSGDAEHRIAFLLRVLKERAMKPFVLEVPSEAPRYAVAVENLSPIHNSPWGMAARTVDTNTSTMVQSPFPTGTDGGKDQTLDSSTDGVMDDVASDVS